MDNKILNFIKNGLSTFRKDVKFYIGKFRSADTKRRSELLFLPVFVLAFTLLVLVLPGADMPEKGSHINTLRVPDFPIILVLEENKGSIKSAWLRTPAGTRSVGQIEDLFYIADSTFLADVDGDGRDDLLWRISFNNFEGTGIHLWIGMTTRQPKIFIATSPFEYTRWDAVPAKLIVPKSTAVYVSPAMPSYDTDASFRGKESYSFVYTVKLTPDGFAFVPVPNVYRQLAVLLRAGIRGEFKPMKRLAYVRMLEEFNSLANGNPPRTGTFLNFQMNNLETIPLRY